MPKCPQCNAQKATDGYCAACARERFSGAGKRTVTEWDRAWGGVEPRPWTPQDLEDIRITADDREWLKKMGIIW